MSVTSDAAEMRLDQRDRSAREYAQDPLHNVALEASAGTGKTRVLVERYVRLLQAGVDPTNVVAITFTRKAAAEMRERIIARLRQAAATGEIAASRWRELRDRLGDIAISTIDAFCLSLLREYPLEADVDPGFDMAVDSEVPRLIEEVSGSDLAGASIWGGWLFVAYAGMLFLFGPALGNLSDAHGRRPILLLSVFGMGVDYVITAMAPSLLWLFIGRLLAGICGASYTIAYAYLTDITPAEGRARAFGIMGADENNRVTSFVEKPAKPPAMPGRPDRALASMGIYVFETQFLFQQLRYSKI